MKASSFTRRVRAGLVAGCAIAMGLAVVPAQAAQVPPPVVQQTSLTANNTWSKIDNAISVDYNRAIDTSLSTVTVTDAAGNPVSGYVGTPFISYFNSQTQACATADIDLTILMIAMFRAPQSGEQCPIHPTGFAVLTQEDGPYTATFTAYAVNQLTGTPPTVTTYTFRVDKGVPAAPSLTHFGSTALPRSTFQQCVLPPVPDPAACRIWPSNPVPKEISVVAPSDDVRLSGYAKDKTDSQGNAEFASGIAKVTLHFFSATSGDASGREIPSMRTDITNACAGGLCQLDQAFQAQPDLPNGYWNIRASATDLAGNVSGQSDPVAVVVLN